MGGGGAAGALTATELPPTPAGALAHMLPKWEASQDRQPPSVRLQRCRGSAGCLEQQGSHRHELPPRGDQTEGPTAAAHLPGARSMLVCHCRRYSEQRAADSVSNHHGHPPQGEHHAAALRLAAYRRLPQVQHRPHVQLLQLPGADHLQRRGGCFDERHTCSDGSDRTPRGWPCARKKGRAAGQMQQSRDAELAWLLR